MASVLHLPSRLRPRLEAWARADYPHEACGLLAGRQTGGRCEVSAVFQARNLATDRAHDRYRLDPEDYLAIDREARARGLDVVGVWHTHPDHPARPSQTDLAAAWPRMSYLILAVGHDGVSALSSWRLEGAAFQEETIES